MPIEAVTQFLLQYNLQALPRSAQVTRQPACTLQTHYDDKDIHAKDIMKLAVSWRSA
jgi:hypothetical protein